MRKPKYWPHSIGSIPLSTPVSSLKSLTPEVKLGRAIFMMQKNAFKRKKYTKSKAFSLAKLPAFEEEK